MSVINQMLKDLDKRQQNERLSSGPNNAVVVNAPQKINLLAIVGFVVAINIVAVIIWQLYSENQQLKESQGIKSKVNPSSMLVEQTQPQAQNKLVVSQQVTPVNNQKAANPLPVKKAPNAEKSKLSDTVKQAERSDIEPHSNAVTKLLAVNQLPVAPAISAKAESESLSKKVMPEQPTLTISRKQLSAQELVAQKLSQAEQALNNDQINQAETLFEDILLVAPDNQTARKQLAALWFGRKSYQAAHNLLSQGLALAPDDSEYRMMKARIYLSQGQKLAAVNTLKVLAELENVEYQALLASNAQQLAQHDVAIQAYQLLVKLQPENGRWWLGLAVAYDSNSQFKQAVTAYHQVRDNSDISESARQFARQRLQQLGE
ncbi:MSHA biogenesis protein MshN [Thalassotalea insulae]|uniref:MSHA biogenesis protein MshN n=1 Tax=Thalassotalea insulae TaxID=2056778 RepID=A0ABQ6GT51_9GAMM|nr:tetratricopeptide repeat protein [Thalassotalea insulae]GLX77870.1 MSHA biogenesis protein MshN [Thalassotalea insulae]